MLVFDPTGLPFWLNVAISMAIVFAYTVKGGVKSVIWIDLLKTLCMIASVVLTIVFIAKSLDINIVSEIRNSRMSKIFFFDDPLSEQYFWKQFLAGIFTVVAIVAPAICLLLDLNSESLFGGYKFSYELLILNAALTAAGLLILTCRKSR